MKTTTRMENVKWSRVLGSKLQTTNVFFPIIHFPSYLLHNTTILQCFKRGCLLLLAGIFFHQLSAQTIPVITSNNLQIIGDSTQGINADTLKLTNEGAAGANVTWDFSTLDSVGTYSRNIVAAANAPSGSIYPTAHHAEHIINGANDIYQYYNANSTDYSMVGFSGSFTIAGLSGITLDSVIYSDADKVMKFPFTYNNSLSDTSLSIYYLTTPAPFAGKATMKHYQGRHTTADGYGTLKLPRGTYNNVLRYKNEIFMTDSIFSSFLNVTMKSYIKEYYWVSPDYRQYLLYDETVFTKDGSQVPRTLPQYFSNPKPLIPVGIEILSVNDKMSVYPNPFNTSTTISIDSKFRIQNSEFRVYDLLGREVMHSQITNNKTPISRSSLTNGMYFYKVMSDNEIIATGKLIVQ